MVSRGKKKRDALRDKIQTLRSITNSHALDETAVIIDASKYIRELKHKVEILSQDVSMAESSSKKPQLPVVSIETQEKGFLIDVFSDKICPGLLVPILETFEELGLDVMEARVCCTDNVQLQALGGELKSTGNRSVKECLVGRFETKGEATDPRVIENAVVRAVKNWSENKRGN